MNIYPYVYRLDHPVTGEFYIGFRAANKVPAEQDLGHKYFTSSKYIKPQFHEFNYQIIAVFFDELAAYDFEQQLIYDNWGDELLQNKACHYQKGRFSVAGQPKSEETKRKMRKPKSDDGRANIAAAAKSRVPVSDEHKAKMSAAWDKRRLIPESEETRAKKSASAKKRRRKADSP